MARGRRTRWVAAGACMLAVGCGSDGSTSVSSRIDDGAATTRVNADDVAVDGEQFVDPQGTYTITIDPTWTEIPGVLVQEIESWAVAAPTDGFAPNINVLTQDALGADLAGYLDFSVANMGPLELIDERVVTGDDGNDLGLLEYAGVVPGGRPDRPLHFLAAIDVVDGTAVVATLTTETDDFEMYRAAIEPLLLTLRAT